MFLANSRLPRILLVDDDANQITILNKTLNAIGQVFFEQDSLSALNQAIKILPDVILLDIEMPHLNGYQVLAELKANEITRNIPVIFITVHESIEEQLLSLKRGAVDFIVKPLRPEVVAARVRTHLRLRDRERELVQVHRHAKVTLESIGDAVLTTDKNGCVTYMNKAAEYMIGITETEAKGRVIEEIMPLRVGDNGPSHINPIRICIEECRVANMATNCQMMKQNGRWMPVEDSASPLVSESGEVVGAVIVFRDINESRAMAIKMSNTFQYDQLTNLPNRFLLMERLDAEMKRTQSNGCQLGLIMLDVDRFKLINEEFGFDFGDRLLKTIASQINTQLQCNETLSRHSADEFIVLVPELERLSDLANLAVKIRENVIETVLQCTDINTFSLSMGVSVYPDDSLDAQSLMLHADAALHRAKSDSLHEGLCFYSKDMELHFIARRQHYMQLKTAISDHKVIALYQPIVNSQTRALEAVEALARIQGNNGYLIPPDEFIPLAEETRLIIPLGERMIQLVFAQLQIWCKDGLSIRVCLNISPIQFLDPHFLSFLLKAMEEYSIDPKMIELEVTESIMLETSHKITRDLTRLRELGISISIDDFGTGFSCLSYLKELPIDVLKIDKAFIAELGIDRPQDVLVKTIANLAQSLGLKSVAEGVETEDQVQFLQMLGVSFLQGYYFSPPIPAGEIKSHYSL